MTGYECSMNKYLQIVFAVVSAYQRVTHGIYIIVSVSVFIV